MFVVRLSNHGTSADGPLIANWLERVTLWLFLEDNYR